MKKTIKILAFSLLTFAGVSQAKAQSLKDLFNVDNVKDALENVAADYIDFSIVGAWQYKGAAVQLSSDSKLAEVGSNLAASSVESKLDEYLQKVGIKPGTMGFTFNDDGSMEVKAVNRTLTGTYVYDKDARELKMTISKVPVTAKVEVLASSFSILFNTDKLLELVKTITQKSSNSTLSTISTTLSAYDGMLVGFSFED